MLPPPPTTRPALPPPPRRGAVLDDSPRPASASFCTRCAGCHDSGSLSLSIYIYSFAPKSSLPSFSFDLLKDPQRGSFLARLVRLARRMVGFSTRKIAFVRISIGCCRPRIRALRFRVSLVGSEREPEASPSAVGSVSRASGRNAAHTRAPHWRANRINTRADAYNGERWGRDVGRRSGPTSCRGPCHVAPRPCTSTQRTGCALS